MPKWIYDLIAFLKKAGQVFGLLATIIEGIERFYKMIVPAAA